MGVGLIRGCLLLGVFLGIISCLIARFAFCDFLKTPQDFFLMFYQKINSSFPLCSVSRLIFHANEISQSACTFRECLSWWNMEKLSRFVVHDIRILFNYPEMFILRYFFLRIFMLFILILAFLDFLFFIQ